MKKKLIAVMLSAVLALGMGACGGGGSDAASNTPSGGGETKAPQLLRLRAATLTFAWSTARSKLTQP